MKNKKATIFGLSFGAIFSIIVIIFIAAVAFFAIRHFMGVNQCAQVGLFYDDLQKEVQRAWSSGRYEDNFVGKLPTSGFFSADLRYACFGNLNSLHAADTTTTEINLELKRYLHDPMAEENVFLYPPKEACEGRSFSYHLKCRNGEVECMTTEDKFFCLPISDEGTVTVHLSKDIQNTLVTVGTSSI